MEVTETIAIGGVPDFPSSKLLLLTDGDQQKVQDDWKLPYICEGGPFTHGCYSRLGDYNEQYGIMEVIDNPTSNKTCIHFTGRRVNEGRMFDWMV
jgi:hypothetical protein